MKFLSCVLLVACVAVAAGAPSNPLGPYKINPDLFTVGGLSSGAFMAVQYQIAFSSQVKGTSVFAGGPFYCAEGNEDTALTTCMNPLISKPNPASLAETTKLLAAEGKIDPISNINQHSVYVYSGILDTEVHRPVVEALVSYYGYFMNSTSPGKVVTEYDILSEHCFPTLDWGEACTTLGSPYIGNCNYDGAGASLKTMYGTLKPRGTMNPSNLFTFNQTQFGILNSLNSYGFIYVPTACQSGATCGLHMNFHGCTQTTGVIGEDYPLHVGLNEWAETNNIIVVYPQVVKSYVFPSNPEGCWDWWGYTGPDYAFQSGYQMQFAHKIVAAIMGQA